MADDKATAPAEAPSQLENAPVTASEAAKSAEAAPESAEPTATEAKAEAAAPPVEGDAASEKPAEGTARLFIISPSHTPMPYSY